MPNKKLKIKLPRTEAKIKMRIKSSSSLKYYLKKAQKEKWAIGQFNFSNAEILQAIIQAAKKSRSPLILGTSTGECQFFDPKKAVVLTEFFRQETGLPVFLNLDHGKSLDYIKEVIAAGYQAVHFDGSDLPLKKNIETTKKVVTYARKRNVLVEGEVGVIGGDLTNPQDALDFVKQTGVDSLAISVGTLHGINKSGQNPPINLKRLAEIKKKVGSIPLVLHGGSGTPLKDIKAAVKLGIVKVNFNTELRRAFTNSLKLFLEKNPTEATPYKYLPQAILSVQKIVEEKIKLLNSVNKI